MKVDKIDVIWAVISFITVGVSFHYGRLLYGLLIIYGLMVCLFCFHIYDVKKKMKNTTAVYGKITGYREKKDPKTFYYPVVDYETEEERAISSVYTIADTEKKYEVGDEELVCYDNDDPLFFYFANREQELTANYYKYMIYGAVPALIVLVLIFVL